LAKQQTLDGKAVNGSGGNLGFEQKLVVDGEALVKKVNYQPTIFIRQLVL
jgi:hypothetical protein